MKTAKLAAIYVTALILIGNTLTAATDKEEQTSKRPYVGVRLDPNPLPELLIKHLKLKANQGLLVYNVQVDSPADKAGIKRDDIIIGFQEKDVAGYDEFVSNIRKEGAGTEVKLEIIHEGDRVTKKLTLAPFEQTDNWKYPFREVPKVQRTPNRIFRMDPGEQQWRQIPFEGLPDDFNRLFRQQQSYHINEGDLNIKIDIVGDPKLPNSQIVVQDMNTGKSHYTTVGAINELPKKYQDTVRDILEKSHQRGGLHQFHFEFPPNLRKFDDDPLIVPQPYQGRDIEKYQEELRRDMEKWQKDLNQRMKEIEKNNRRLREQLEKSHKEKPDEKKEPKDDSDSL
jgi:PDZ domain-containing protein